MQDYIKPSLDYIEQNLKADIKTEELANMTGYSVTHYRRMFAKITGLSVANYISKKRINHALFEIISGRKAIDAVLEYGFDTYAGFYKAFVKMHGCSPMKYLTIYKDLTPKEMEEILMEYNLTEQQKNRISERWGNGFYLKVLENFDLYSEKWKLIDFEFFEDYWHHVMFYCKSELYGDCVLEIYDEDELAIEYNTLLEYNNIGEYYIKALGYEPGDHSNGAILTERVFPGKWLIDDAPLEKRLAVFSELFNKLYSEHGVRLEPKNPEMYYSYTKWVTDNGRFGEDMSKREDKKLHPHAVKAKELYLEMVSVYDKKILLNGDLTSNNIISYGNGKYKVGKPAGVIGDPVFEAGMFIFGECCWYGRDLAELEKAEIIIDYLEKSLNIPNKILRQSFYITTVMCYQGDLDRLRFAESVMNL